MNIGYDLENENGVFCNLFLLLSTYIYCRKNNKKLLIKDDKWNYTHTNGLADYFKPNDYYEICNEPISSNIVFYHAPRIGIGLKEIIHTHTLNDYRHTIKEFYILNNNIYTQLEKYKNKINLPKEYNSIFVRCGDKLIYESKYYKCNYYIDYLLNLKTKCNNLFIHSDDNNVVKQYIKYINDNKLDFNIYYITEEIDNGGTTVRSSLKHPMICSIKCVDEMNNIELKNHTEKMLCAIEIMKKSKNVILDYQSNVSRFIKLYFDCNVHTIFYNNQLELNKEFDNHKSGMKLFPGHGAGL